MLYTGHSIGAEKAALAASVALISEEGCRLLNGSNGNYMYYIP